MTPPGKNPQEVPPGELTGREALREMGIILGDIFVAVIAIFIGFAIHSWLQLPSYLMVLGMLPFSLWFWWRGKLPREAVPLIVIASLLFTLYMFAVDAGRIPQNGWGRWGKTLASGLIYLLAHFLASVWRRWCPPKARSDTFSQSKE